MIDICVYVNQVKTRHSTGEKKQNDPACRVRALQCTSRFELDFENEA